MYKTQAETRAFFAALKPLVAGSTHCDIVVAPPYTALAAAVEAVRGSSISIAAQDVHWEKEGAFTGEVSTKRSEERRVGKECRSRGGPDREQKSMKEIEVQARMKEREDMY